MASSRKASKERTRGKLIQATLKVLYKHGPAALTTGRIAEHAGVAQPTFYVHFSDMEDALTQAADTVAEKLLQRLKDYREPVRLDGPLEPVRAAFAATVNALLSEPKMAELFLRHRRDVASPLGRRWREIVDRARADLLADMRAMGLEETVPHLDILGDLIVGMVLTVVEGVLDRRITDRDAAIETLVRVTIAQLIPGADQPLAGEITSIRSSSANAGDAAE